MRNLRNFRYGADDKIKTRNERKSRPLRDRRSKIVHDLSGEKHILLFGRDIAAQRSLLLAVRGFHCEICGIPANSEDLEMDHKQGGLTGRCDCLHNLQMLCRRCHTAKHDRTVRFGPDRPQAEQEFIDICEREDRQ